MPTPIIIDNGIQVRTTFQLVTGILAYQFLYVTASGTFTSAQATAIGTAIRAPWLTYLQNRSHTSTVYVASKLTDVRTTTGPQFTIAYGNAGTAGGDPMPPAVAGVVSWYTALRGRRYRGRTYLAGMDETQSLGIGPTTNMQTAMNDWATVLRSGLVTAGFPLLVASNLLGHGNAVTSHAVRVSWKSQRRRAGVT